MSAENKKATETKTATKKPIFVPRLPNSKHQPPLEGSVNGRAFLLPRGKESMVSPEVYEVVKRSLINEVEAEEYYKGVQDELIKRSHEEAQNIR